MCIEREKHSSIEIQKLKISKVLIFQKHTLRGN